MTLFDLVAKLTMDASGFDKGVRDAETAGHNLSDKMGSMFDKIETVAKAVITGAVFKKVADTIKGLADETAQMGDRIDKQSQVLGMSRQAYQEWDYILSQNGSSIESMGVAMKTLNSLILSGVDGSKESADALAQLGLHLDEISDLSQEDQFESVVRAFQKMPAGAQKSALAVKIFGRQGMQLLPLLNNSATSIDELREKAQSLGLIMSDDAVDASVAYTDALDTLQRTFNGVKYSIGSKILPVLTGAFEKITGYAGKLKKAYDENGLQGVWDVLTESFRNIKWPTWEELQQGVIDFWNTIKEGAKSVLIFIFGEDENGGIKWPTASEIWEKVKSGLETLWNGIQGLATTVLKLVFGEDENGGIDWGTAEGLWHKIGTGLNTLWNGIKDFARNILVFAFGEDRDGGIKFPTAEETYAAIGNTLASWWGGVRRLAKGVLNLLLGALGLPDVDETVKQIKEWWEDVKKKIALKIFVKVGGYQGFGFDPSKGETWAEGVQKTNEQFGIKPATITQEDIERWESEGYAKGLWDVPYDDFQANLHRGEMVLTASQARDYRDGVSGLGFDVQSFMSSLSQTVKNAIESATVRSYINGKDLTDEVNRNNMNSIKARRYAR